MPFVEHEEEFGQLVAIGKEKGYLLYEEVSEVLPPDAISPDELDAALGVLASAGIEVVGSEQAYCGGRLRDAEEAAEGPEADLAGVLEKSQDPVRLYFREMGAVRLLNREKEVVIADVGAVYTFQLLRPQRALELGIANIFDLSPTAFQIGTCAEPSGATTAKFAFNFLRSRIKVNTDCDYG